MSSLTGLGLNGDALTSTIPTEIGTRNRGKALHFLRPNPATRRANSQEAEVPHSLATKQASQHAKAIGTSEMKKKTEEENSSQSIIDTFIVKITSAKQVNLQ